MILAFVLAALANLIVLRRADVTYPVAMAATDLLAGRKVGPSDLRLVEIDAEPGLLATLVTDVARLEGSVVVRTVRSGELLRRSDLAAGVTQLMERAMSIAIEPEHAVGGEVAVGDRIDVIAVREGSTSFVVVGAEVIDVAEVSRGGLPGGSGFFVVVAVDADTALSLAEAMRTGDIELVRSTGSITPERLSLEEPVP